MGQVGFGVRAECELVIISANPALQVCFRDKSSILVNLYRHPSTYMVSDFSSEFRSSKINLSLEGDDAMTAKKSVMTNAEWIDAMKARQQLEGRVIGRAWEDAEFRKFVLSDPGKAIEQVLGQTLPQGLKVDVTEEAPDTFHMVLPTNPDVARELSDGDLAQAAGGALLSIDGIKGESLPDTHKDWIEVLSYKVA